MAEKLTYEKVAGMAKNGVYQLRYTSGSWAAWGLILVHEGYGEYRLYVEAPNDSFKAVYGVSLGKHSMSASKNVFGQKQTFWLGYDELTIVKA